jgi:SAM dependent carboxyl methyltransferase
MTGSDIPAPGPLGPTGAAMEGGGSYNRNSAQQAAGGMSALPLLEKAAASVAIEPGEAPVVIADFGSSQGRNSLVPLGTAIRSLRTRLGTDRPICVFHTDQPGNDFSTLFHVVHTDPGSYLRDQPNVFAFATGKSFYEPLFPPNTITLGWSSYALMWPSRLAALIPGHVFSTRSSGAVLAAFDKQGDEDWRRFLSLRATELRPGGRLVIVIAARGDDGLNGLEPLMDHANAVLSDMFTNGTISAAERERMVVPAHPKSLRDLMAPFASNSRFHGLAMEQCEVFTGPDPVWDDYQRHHDRQRVAAHQAGFFRAAFGPTFANALNGDRSATDRAAFIDKLEQGVEHRVAANPVATRQIIGVMMITKA